MHKDLKQNKRKVLHPGTKTNTMKLLLRHVILSVILGIHVGGKGAAVAY